MFDNWKNIKEILHYESLFYILKIIKIQLINKYYDKGTLKLK